MKVKINWRSIKEALLGAALVAGYIPFLAALLGLELGIIVDVGILTRVPSLYGKTPYLRFVPYISGALLGGVYSILLRSLLAYQPRSGLYFMLKGAKLLGWGNPLRRWSWQKGIETTWVTLPRTDRPRQVEVTLRGLAHPILMKIGFKESRREFDSEEVYRKLVEFGYTCFDQWLEDRFVAAALGSEAVRELLASEPEAHLEPLTNMLRSTLIAAGWPEILLSNIKTIKVTLITSRSFCLD